MTPDIVASTKYKGIFDFISLMYEYHADTDMYLPKYGAVKGRAMRYVIDEIAGMTTAYLLNQTEDRFLVPDE